MTAADYWEWSVRRKCKATAFFLELCSCGMRGIIITIGSVVLWFYILKLYDEASWKGKGIKENG